MKKGARFLTALLASSIAFGVEAQAYAAQIQVDDKQQADSAEYWYDYDDNYWLAPSKITEFTCDSVKEDSVSLSWYYWQSEVSYYEIARYEPETNTYTVIKTVDRDKYTCEITGLESCTKYSFAVRAVNEYASGEYSEPISVSTAPTALRQISASYKSKGKINVKWEPVSGTQGYIVQCSTSKSFENDGRTVSKILSGQTKKSVAVSGLAQTGYYVRVLPYIQNGELYCFPSKNVQKKTVTVKSGLSMKELINNINTSSNSSRDRIKNLTKQKVDISKYKTTYDKVMAIYKWHVSNALKFGDCLSCNSNFNDCLYELFGEPSERNLWIAAGNYINNSGSRVMHKWSGVYLAGVPYLFDPRMQKYVYPSGTNYFGFGMKSSLAKAHYDFQGWYFCTNDYR